MIKFEIARILFKWLFVDVALIVAEASYSSFMVGGFRSEVLLAVLEDESVPLAIWHCGTDRLWYWSVGQVQFTGVEKESI